MSWPIVLHAARPDAPRVGDMWPAPWLAGRSAWCSTEYTRDHAAKRAPLVVVLPGYGEWCIDSPMSGAPGNSGWTVTGEAPALTLSPSVNARGAYHGWIRDGVITDDCEGRQFT